MAGTAKITNDMIIEAIQLKYKGKTLANIKDYFLQKYNIDVAIQTISAAILRTQKKLQPVDKQPVNSQSTENNNIITSPQDPQDILYENRKEVTRMKKEGYINYTIAQHFGVKEEDVIEFLSKRRKISPEDKRDILYRYSQGEDINHIANIYSINSKTVETLLNNSGKVITTSSQVMSKIAKNKEDEFKNETFDPSVIKNFINFINTVQYKYDYCLESMEKFNNVRNDIYHKLELDDIDTEEQLKLLEKIKETSVERREMKDFVEIVEPLIKFMNVPENKKSIATLANISGMISNKVKSMNTRVYFLREEEDE